MSNTYHLLDSIRVGNHSLHFVDPATSVHTQHAKSYWSRVKTKFKWMKGVHENMLPSYLDAFMWWERHGSTASTALSILLSSTLFRIPRRTICWSISPTVFAFVFSTVFFFKTPTFRNLSPSKHCRSIIGSRDTSQGRWEWSVAIVWLPDFVVRLVRQVRLIRPSLLSNMQLKKSF